jgi:hypothetical protein
VMSCIGARISNGRPAGRKSCIPRVYHAERKSGAANLAA